MTDTSDLEFLQATRPRFVFCGVDMQVPGTRPRVALLCHHLHIPCVFAAISLDADWGYVFVQGSKEGDACFNCVFKEAEEMGEGKSGEPPSDDGICPGVPSTCDIQKTLAGIALYAMDSIVMNRARDWNLWTLSLSRADFGGARFVKPRADCLICSSRFEIQFDDSLF